MIIDSHCHLHDEKFLGDLEDVLLRAKEANISHMVSIGCDVETTLRAKELADKVSNIYFSAGFHPHDAKLLSEQSFDELTELAKDKKCVAIGECGLDYYYNHSNREEQQNAFIKQIGLAKELKLPLVIHLRDAHEDCIKILTKYLAKDQKVVIHCFSGTLDNALEFHQLGCFISLSGIITFKKPGDLLKVAQTIPLEKLMVETDSPYLSPHPHRGKRNEPGFILNTLRTVAEARGESIEMVEEKIHETTRQFFGFSQR